MAFQGRLESLTIMTAVPSPANAIADLPRGDALAEVNYTTDDLMARHERAITDDVSLVKMGGLLG